MTQHLYGVVTFAGFRSRDGAKLTWERGRPGASVYAAFDVPSGGTLEGWRNRVLKHRGEAVFVAAGYPKMRLNDAVVAQATEVTGILIVSPTEPERIA